MSITVKLGTNTSDDRCLNKNVNYTKTATCDVYKSTDRINPVILLDNDNAHIDLADINYMEIEEFGRKYFITSVVGQPGKRIEIYGHVDVLSTYADQIKTCPLIAARSTNQYNTYLEDNQRIFSSEVINQYVRIGEVGPPNNIYLITLGSG